jgi:hypothetical protein
MECDLVLFYKRRCMKLDGCLGPYKTSKVDTKYIFLCTELSCSIIARSKNRFPRSSIQALALSLFADSNEWNKRTCLCQFIDRLAGLSGRCTIHGGLAHLSLHYLGLHSLVSSYLICLFITFFLDDLWTPDSCLDFWQLELIILVRGCHVWLCVTQCRIGYSHNIFFYNITQSSK